MIGLGNPIKMTKRTVNTYDIYQAVKDLVYEANFILIPEVDNKFHDLKENESEEMPVETLQVLIENAEIS